MTGYGEKVPKEVNSLAIQNSYWVIPDRFRAGAHPGFGSAGETKRKLHWLMELGINFIVDLTETKGLGTDYSTYITETASMNKHQVTYKRIPLQDYGTPSHEKMVEILDTIDAALSEGNNIYLHCLAGMGRTGMTVGCYLVRHGTSGGKALEKIQELRREISDGDRRSPETEEQRRMVVEWTKGQ
jgi:protein-tyrosine phosphatase